MGESEKFEAKRTSRERPETVLIGIPGGARTSTRHSSLAELIYLSFLERLEQSLTSYFFRENLFN